MTGSGKLIAVEENPLIPTDQIADSVSHRESATPLARFRAWVVLAFGLPLASLSFWMVIRMEWTDVTGLPTGLAIYYHVVVLFAVLLLAQRAWTRWAMPKSALSRAELLCIYSMMNIASAFACWESLPTVVPALGLSGLLHPWRGQRGLDSAGPEGFAAVGGGERSHCRSGRFPGRPVESCLARLADPVSGLGIADQHALSDVPRHDSPALGFLDL